MNITYEDIISAVESAGLSTDIKGIKGEDSLADFGIDSLERMSFFLAIEEKYDVNFPDDDIDLLNTIKDITIYMERF